MLLPVGRRPGILSTAGGLLADSQHPPSVRRVTWRPERIWALVLKVSILVAAAFLLSIGGMAIYATPVTVPLLTYITIRDRLARGWRIAAALVLALTLSLCAWFAVYVSMGESQPWIWFAPVGVVAAFAAVGAALLLRQMLRSR